MTTRSNWLRRGVLRHDPDALRQARAYAKLTQVQLAGLAGISQPYLSMLEHGMATPSGELLGALAAALGVSTDSLRAAARTPS